MSKKLCKNIVVYIIFNKLIILMKRIKIQMQEFNMGDFLRSWDQSIKSISFDQVFFQNVLILLVKPDPQNFKPP